jgi:phospholipase/lecithinase/hemolysin
MMNPRQFRNYAYGQAQTIGAVTLKTHDAKTPNQSWSFTVPDLAGQITQYLHEGNIQTKQSDIFIFIGTNDFFNYSPQSQAKDQAFVNKQLQALEKQIARLEQHGATHLVIFNIRNLTYTPLAKQLAQQLKHDYLNALDHMIRRYNTLLYKHYQHDNRVLIYDIYHFDQQTLNTTTPYPWYRQHFTLKEKTKPCYINQGNYIDQVGTICAKPWEFFYYDRVHTSTYVNKQLSDKVVAFLQQHGWQEK